jgi:FMN reductase
MPPTLTLLGGSLREPSRTLALLQTSLAFAQERGIDAQLLDIRELDLPMFVPDWTLEAYPLEKQAAIAHLVEAYRRTHVMVWASPTYHGTVSGVFKNAIDFAELLADDARPYLSGCAVGIIAVNDTSTLTAMSHSVHDLRGWLAPTQVMAAEDSFSEMCELIDDRIKRRLARQIDELNAFAVSHFSTLKAKAL